MAGPKVSKVSKVSSQKPDSVKVKLTIGRASYLKLKRHCFGLGDVPLGQVVDQLIEAMPVRFVLMDRGKGGADTSNPSTATAPESPGTRPALGLHSEVA